MNRIPTLLRSLKHPRSIEAGAAGQDQNDESLSNSWALKIGVKHEL